MLSLHYVIIALKHVRAWKKRMLWKDKNNLPIKEKIILTHHHLTMYVIVLR